MNTDGLPHSGDPPDRVRVGVAEFGVATGETRLTTSGLGSCVGVALADPDADVAGLAHAMLPSGDDDRARPAKSVPQGVERLLAAVESAGADPDRIEAKIAGGSRMLDFSGVGEGVGDRNVAAARETLAECGVPVVAEDVGGSHGRSLSVCPRTWTLTVTSAHDGEVEL
ncbi:chemotaxis protein CheD [Halorussus amylolyticus]|uniref:chemotaxis protein CheD n=1 Tax=Halorussus amylolyticus TaxID=1126242 RepID=UPI0010498E62|nr:chemotaxis protein CheD [Halorussus amylolyticus]